MPAFFNSPWFTPIIIWSLAWKGYALWIAARRGQKIWFVLLFIVNTFGIFEILYIYVFCRIKRIPSVSDASGPPVIKQ